MADSPQQAVGYRVWFTICGSWRAAATGWFLKRRRTLMARLKLTGLIILVVILLLDQGGALCFADTVDLVAERSQNAVLIVDKTGRALGSGLLTYFTFLEKRTLICALTNRHVVEGVDSLFVRVNASSGIVDVHAGVVPGAVMPPGVDLTLLILHFPKEVALSAKSQPLARDQMMAVDSLHEGAEVFYLGFPLGLGAGTTSTPLVRFGHVAQILDDQRTFLIDGFASHGNSGSPVFTIPDGKFVGLIMGFRPDFITAENKSEHLYLQMPYNSGIAVAIKSNEIIKVVMELFPRIEPLLKGK
ncbi:MAG: serine protease [Candidatus Zixiibacteriota bacterium]|nr:MAG: serine protease [candidate division Zixibacteria bacterium]